MEAVTDERTEISLVKDNQAGTLPDPKGLLLALELMELGVALARQRIMRLNPGASEAEILTKTNTWICTPRASTYVGAHK